MADEPLRLCASCARPMEPRRRWRGRAAEVRYCSARCRRRKIAPVDRALERAILEILAERDPRSSMCPSEAARAVGVDGWRPLMERARAAGRRLAAAGLVVFTVGGARVDPGRARGAVRLMRGLEFLAR